MRILGFNFKKISCERKKPLKGQLKINSNININDIEEEKSDLIKNQDLLKFHFTFLIDYSKSAEVIFQGIVLIAVDKKEKIKILKDWKKKKFEEKYRLPLFNMILNKCNILRIVFL